MISELIKILNRNKKKLFSLRNKKFLKLDKSYVSEADLMIQKIVDNYLLKKFNQNYFLLSEENYKNKKINFKKYRNIFILDPIDGTENFISGIPHWGISFSWFQNLKHKDSFIFFPEINEQLLFKNYKSKNLSRIIALSSSNNKYLKKFKDFNEIRITGCCVYNLYNVIKGKFRSYENQKANVWDFIAGFNIAIKNNIEVRVNGKKYNGEFLYPNTKYNIKIKNK